MSVVEIPENLAAELASELKSRGIPTSMHREDRYFGDAQTISLVLDIANSSLSIAAAVISIWAVRQQVGVRINGTEVARSESAEQSEADIKKALQK